ncbi:MAG: hypothetical protein V7L29_17090 [Nostoc sp.]|uniref:hypothetical protein n=1 Tax=Nostoc sp. TaxID=1180 RepID=UPI002FF36B83
MSTDPKNTLDQKEQCEEKGWEWIDPPGECVPPFEILNDKEQFHPLNNKEEDKNHEKEQCEEKGWEWIDPPGECVPPRGLRDFQIKK